MAFIGFLSDFGLEDEWVAACKGVIYEVAPESTIIDLSHLVPPFDVRKGALILASSLPYLPVGICVAVVDPGVGGARRAIAVRVARGDTLVGPDNGLLIPAAGRLGGIAEAVAIENRIYMREEVHPTFHGRDIFAPVAAHLATGLALTELGPAVDTTSLVMQPWPQPTVTHARIVCHVIDIERFGSLRLSVSAAMLQQAGITHAELTVEAGNRTYSLPLVATFSDVPEGALLAALDSSGWLSLAVNRGSAAERLGLGIDDEVTISVLPG